MSLGEKIKSLREERGMSLENLANQLGVDPYKVFIWEKNSTRPDVDSLIKMAELFDVSLDELAAEPAPQADTTAYSAPAYQTQVKPKKEKKKASDGFIALQIILAVACIAAIYLVNMLAMKGEDSIVNVAGNPARLFLLCLIPLACLVFGIVAQCKGYSGLANIIIGGIFLLICAFFCTVWTLSLSIMADEDTTDYVALAEETAGIKLPACDYVSGRSYGETDDEDSIFAELPAEQIDGSILHYSCYAEIPEEADRAFCREISESELWIKGIPTEFVGLISCSCMDYGADYILIYNLDTQEYNTMPEKSGTYTFLFISYDPDNLDMHIAEYEMHVNLLQK